VGAAVFLGLALIATLLIAIIIGYIFYGAFLGIAALARLAKRLWSELEVEDRTAHPWTASFTGEVPSRKLGQQRTQGEHCWDIKQCPLALRINCPAYREPDLPCWLARLQATKDSHLMPECMACRLFNLTAMLS
jgi:hypothetical protein